MPASLPKKSWSELAERKQKKQLAIGTIFSGKKIWENLENPVFAKKY
jgi:hypothetical protein